MRLPPPVSRLSKLAGMAYNNEHGFDTAQCEEYLHSIPDLAVAAEGIGLPANLSACLRLQSTIAGSTTPCQGKPDWRAGAPRTRLKRNSYVSSTFGAKGEAPYLPATMCHQGSLRLLESLANMLVSTRARGATRGLASLEQGIYIDPQTPAPAVRLV